MADGCDEDAVEARIREDVEAFGMHVAYLEDDGYNPGFGYSIGLFKTYGHPEILLIGQGFERTAQFLNKVRDAVAGGRRFVRGDLCEGFLKGLPVRLGAVLPEHRGDWLGYADWFNGSSDYPVLQLLWPDRKGIFPGEAGYDEGLVDRQPALDADGDFRFREPRDLGVYTTKDILAGAPVLHVFHDEEGDWQFHSSQEPDASQAALVALGELVRLDPTLNGIRFLNYGEAASRESVGGEWEISEEEA